MRDKVIEIMARAMKPEWFVSTLPEQDRRHAAYMQKLARTEAVDVLTALESAGFPVVPAEPTEGMVEAADEAFWSAEEGRLSDDDDYHRHHIAAYRAMLKAAKEG